MKRLYSLVLVLLMLLALEVPAYADIMWEPRDDGFYESHREQCSYENRSYCANGPKGFVTLWDAPGGGMVRAQYENGEILWVGFTYKDWALVNRWEDRKEITGWVKLSELYLLYDHISFAEEYGEQFRDYGGEFGDYVPQEEGERFGLWEYPLDYWPREWLEMNPEFLDALRGTADQSSYISKVYIDSGGEAWGFVNYMYGIRNFWILLDNPTCNGIMCCSEKVGDLIYDGVITAPQTPVLPAKGYTPYILVALVVGATGGILAFFYGKRRKSTK